MVGWIGEWVLFVDDVDCGCVCVDCDLVDVVGCVVCCGELCV